MDQPLTAAILLIGDELLTGKVRESNGYFLIGALRGLGAQVTELHMVSDQVERIDEALRLVKDRNEVVFCCGGVGPTHDDRTMEAVARAWGVPMAVQPEMEALLRLTYGDDTEKWMKIAHMPEGCELVFHTPGGWPCCRMGHVYLFPGSPLYVQAHFRGLKERFTRPTPVYLATMDLHLDEGELVTLLSDAEARFVPVQIGSYPVTEEAPYKVRVTIEARELGVVSAACAWLRQRVGEDAIYAERMH
jgi:molybdenum cofactor synthesis domain-containing protein